MTTTNIPSPLSLVGHVAFDREGDELGEIAGVYLDRQSSQPEWAAVRLVGGGITVVPLADAVVYEDSLEVPFTRQQVAAAPYQRRRLSRELSEDEEAALYRHYSEGRGSLQAASTEVASAAREQGQQVASAAQDQAQQVASAAQDQAQQVASAAKDQAQQVASTVKDEGQAVVRSAAQQATEVVGTAREQAAQVAGEASAQARGVLEETRTRLEEQAVTGTSRLAENLQRLGEEALALSEGRADDAVFVGEYVRRAGERLLEAADRVHGVADDVDSRGLEGVLEDVQHFARRRPGLFLLGTAVAGFAVGRAVRSARADGAAADQQDAPAPAQAAVRPRAGRRPGTPGRR